MPKKWKLPERPFNAIYLITFKSVQLKITQILVLSHKFASKAAGEG